MMYFSLNYSNDICAEYIIGVTKNKIKKGAIIVVDYLQLLDQKRENPPLQEQIVLLKSFAKENGCIIIFLSQIDRKIKSRLNQRPVESDIRLPNSLDLNLINKKIFLFRENENSKEVEVSMKNHIFKVGWSREEIKFFDR